MFRALENVHKLIATYVGNPEIKVSQNSYLLSKRWTPIV